MKLRPYQEEAVASFFNYFVNGGTGNPLLVLPTGAGKSVIIAEILKRIYAEYPFQKVIVLTHVKELIEQNYLKLKGLWPEAPAGIYSAGLGKRDLSSPITFAGIASVAKRAFEFGAVNLVFIDEAHLINAKGSGQYVSFLNQLRISNPKVKFCGLTATPFRLGQGLLTDPIWSREIDGEVPALFTDVAYDLSSMDAFTKLIDDGYLSPLVPKQTALELDVSDVKTTAGDFNQGDLQMAVNKQSITTAAIEEALEVASDRKHWLVFAAGVDHAKDVSNLLNVYGVPSCVVTGDMASAERDANIKGFKEGKFRALVNNSVLTTGFDFAKIDLIIMLRPTQSTVLWVQALGRGTRVHPDKRDCLVLDFAGNTKRLGPINDPVIPKGRGKGAAGKAPVKVCPECDTIHHTSVRVCDTVNSEGIKCGHIFTFQTKIEQVASTLDLVKSQIPKVENFKVDFVIYSAHTKIGSPISLKVSYVCGLTTFSEYVCLEHPGKIHNKAVRWWKDRCNLPVPATVAEALTHTDQLRQPIGISVWINKKYPEITNFIF